MNLQRLDKIIASQLNISRTNAKTDIRNGFVSVDGVTVKDPALSYSPEKVNITYKGQAVYFIENSTICQVNMQRTFTLWHWNE